jgi:hypothetical protein
VGHTSHPGGRSAGSRCSPPQSRPAPTSRALPSNPADQRGQNWTPMRGQICEPIDIFPTAGPFAFLASSLFPDATSRNAGSTKARSFCCGVGDAQVKVCGGVCAGIGGRRARMMGCDFDASCECCARSFEVVERSTASLNSFTSFGEAVPGFLGGGFAFLTVSVEPMLVACHLSTLPLSQLHSSSIAARKDVT